MKREERIVGSLVCGAVGDALGYAVEFHDLSEIINEYGKDGIRSYAAKEGEVHFSDDTQMTLFTLDAILRAKKANMLNKKELPRFFYESYLDWLYTQKGSAVPIADGSELLAYPQLLARRAPGNTCLSALYSGVMGTVQAPINNSKGCGGVMRVAPIALALSGRRGFTSATIAQLAADAAAITHGHPSGYISAAAFAYIVSLVMEGKDLRCAVLESAKEISEIYKNRSQVKDVCSLLLRAVELADSDVEPYAAIDTLGEGWVGEEALAIAVYSVLKHPDDARAALITAVNHSGDSDSTGAIAGNIIGAYLGESAVGSDFTDRLELHSLIVDMAKRAANL